MDDLGADDRKVDEARLGEYSAFGSPGELKEQVTACDGAGLRPERNIRRSVVCPERGVVAM
jgi:hypothetical protein